MVHSSSFLFISSYSSATNINDHKKKIQANFTIFSLPLSLTLCPLIAGLPEEMTVTLDMPSYSQIKSARYKKVKTDWDWEAQGGM